MDSRRKKCRALKNVKTYNEPQEVVKQKKKRRARPRKEMHVDIEPLVITLEETASSSTCLRAHEQASTQRKQKVQQGLDAKHWANVRSIKATKRVARDELVAALYANGMLNEEGDSDVDVPSGASRLKIKHSNKASSRAEKTRRRKRFEAAAAQCYSLDALEDMPEELLPGQAKSKGEGEESTPQLPTIDADIHVGTRFAIDAKDEAADDKQGAKPESAEMAAAQKRGKGKKCIVM
jgi:hypothetical protein